MNTVSIKKPESVNLDKLRRLELCGSLCPLVDVGMYESIISPSYWEDCARDNLIEDYGDAGLQLACFGDFDWDGYKKVVQSHAADIIDEYAMPILNDYGIAAIKVVGIYSPREYNFTTDELNFDVYLSEDFDAKFAENMKRFRKNPSLQKYIEDHWWHRSGFHSFMPKSMDEIASFEDDVRCLACYMTFALLTEEYWNNFYEDRTDWELFERLNTDECCTDFTHVYLYCSEEWAQVYNDNIRMDELYWDVFHALGHPWNNHTYKDDNLCTHEDNEALQLVIWATDMGYSPQDLREMCA